MDNADSYLGSMPPVTVNAQLCHNVKIEVKFIKETRDHDTLRKWAEIIDRVLTEHSGPIKKIAGCVVLMLCLGDVI